MPDWFRCDTLVVVGEGNRNVVAQAASSRSAVTWVNSEHAVISEDLPRHHPDENGMVVQQ